MAKTMKPLVLVLIILAMICSSAHSANAPAIVVIDGETPTNEIARMPNGGYVGETIIHRSPDERVQVGVWEADVSKVRLVDFPVTEYVLMLSGRLVVVNEDGSSNTFEAGDTFVIPKGFTGIWDVQERMKKQHIKIGDPRAELIVLPVED